MPGGKGRVALHIADQPAIRVGHADLVRPIIAPESADPSAQRAIAAAEVLGRPRQSEANCAAMAATLDHPASPPPMQGTSAPAFPVRLSSNRYAAEARLQVHLQRRARRHSARSGRSRRRDRRCPTCRSRRTGPRPSAPGRSAPSRRASRRTRRCRGAAVRRAPQCGQAGPSPSASVPGRARVAGAAPGGFELTVHVQQPLRAGALVQIVDILA